jgi:hypothetical protein
MISSPSGDADPDIPIFEPAKAEYPEFAIGVVESLV